MNSLVSSHAHATHASLHLQHVLLEFFGNVGVALAPREERSLKVFILVLLSGLEVDFVL